MFAKKFGLFGSRESEVFSYFASKVRARKIWETELPRSKKSNFCKHVFNFLGFCHFPFYFFAIWILEFYGRWHGNFFFSRQKKWNFLCRKHNRMTDTESDRNPEKTFWVSFFNMKAKSPGNGGLSGSHCGSWTPPEVTTKKGHFNMLNTTFSTFEHSLTSFVFADALQLI